MAIAEVKEQPVTLVLEAKEARYLKLLTQNYLGNQGEETHDENNHREAIWEALHSVIPD